MVVLLSRCHATLGTTRTGRWLEEQSRVRTSLSPSVGRAPMEFCMFYPIPACLPSQSFLLLRGVVSSNTPGSNTSIIVPFRLELILPQQRDRTKVNPLEETRAT